MEEQTKDDIIERGVSGVETVMKINFDGVIRKGKYHGSKACKGVFRKPHEGKVVIVEKFYLYIHDKLSTYNFDLKKSGYNDLFLEIVEYNDNISSSKNGGVQLINESKRKVIKVDPKEYLKIQEANENDRDNFNVVTNHFIDIAQENKTRTDKKTAKKVLKLLSSPKALRELQDKAPIEYSKFVAQTIKSTRITDQSSLIQDGLKSSLFDAIALCKLMLNGKTKDIIANNDFKSVLNMKSDAMKVSELHWQNFIFTFKELIFFDYVELIDEMHIIDTPEGKGSRYDFFMIDEYNYPKIIELKKADVRVYVDDKSHDKKAFSSEVSKAISQLMNYMDIFVHSFDDLKNKKSQEIKEKIKGNRTVSGVLIIGGGKINGNEPEENCKELWTQNNYLHNITVITYKDIYDSLINKYKFYKKNTSRKGDFKE